MVQSVRIDDEEYLWLQLVTNLLCDVIDENDDLEEVLYDNDVLWW